MSFVMGKAGNMGRNNALLLFAVILIALLLRLMPPLLYGMPISYDAPFHERAAFEIIKSKTIPLYELSAYQRPNNYPPFYHVVLSAFSLLSGISVHLLSLFTIPFFSALACISIFLLSARLFGTKKALLASFLAAIMPFLVSNSYDSPENFAFFILPVIILLIISKKPLLASFLYSTLLFWNYFIFLATLLPFILAFRQEKKFILGSFSFTLFFFLFGLLTRGFSIVENKSLEVGMDFVQYNLRNFMPFAILFSVPIAAAIAFLYLRQESKKQRALDFFLFFSLLSIFCLLSSFFTNFLRPWEHFKFASISSIFLGVFLYSKRSVKLLYAFSIALLSFSLILSTQSLFPRITSTDLLAISFLESNYSEGIIVAEPSLSEHIGLYAPSLSKSLATSLYYENLPKESIMPMVLRFLMLDKSINSNKFLADANISYIALNYEDFTVRDAYALYGSIYLDKVYSLGYYINCPLSFINKDKSYACYYNETVLLKTNSLLNN